MQRSNFVRFLSFRPRDNAPAATAPNFSITADAIKALIAREGGGDSNKAIESLMRENHRARKRAKVAEGMLDTLGIRADAEGKRVVPSGVVVVTAEEKKQLDVIVAHLKETKLTPEKLIELAKKTGDLEVEIAKRDRRVGIATVAKAAEYNEDALIEILEAKRLEVSMRDVSVKGDDNKTVKESRPFVRPLGDEKAEWTPLPDYVDANLKAFKPALEAKPEAEADDETDEGAGSQRRDEGTGTRFPAQTRSKEPPKGGKSDKQIREEAISRGNVPSL